MLLSLPPASFTWCDCFFFLLGCGDRSQEHEAGALPPTLLLRRAFFSSSGGPFWFCSLCAPLARCPRRVGCCRSQNAEDAAARRQLSSPFSSQLAKERPKAPRVRGTKEKGQKPPMGVCGSKLRPKAPYGSRTHDFFPLRGARDSATAAARPRRQREDSGSPAAAAARGRQGDGSARAAG